MSSHKEAPEISKDPVADSTDVYAFVSPDKPDTVTLIANYVPLQDPDGGPNFNEFGDDVQYDIVINNSGTDTGVAADIIYRFHFTSVLEIPSTFLYNVGPITITDGRLDTSNWNRRQYYSVTKVVGTKSTTLASNLACPPCNIGPVSTPNYEDTGADGGPEDFTKAFIYTLPTGETVFAGQRAEGFFVDLGSVFELGTLRPLANAHIGMLSEMDGVNSLSAKNIHSIAIQVPITAVAKGGKKPTDPTLSSSVIGVHTTASRQAMKSYGSTGKPTNTGAYVQVSRLANPLFNEVIVNLGAKDLFNASDPAGDSQFQARVDDPELAQLLPVLYPGAFPNLAAYNKTIKAGTVGRPDIDAVFLTGLPQKLPGADLGLTTYTGKTKAELLRLNLAVPPTQTTDEAFSIFGLVYGDAAGFPNGRRVYDDVTTIELQALAGLTLPLVDTDYTPDSVVKSVTDGLVNSGTDITVKGTVTFLTSFPYLGTPHSGYYTPTTTPPASNTAPSD